MTDVPTPRDRGTSMVELLVTIVLLGTVGVVVLASFAMSLRASGISDRVAQEQARLATASDIIANTAISTSSGCDTAYQQALDARATEAGWATGDVTVLEVESWNGTVFTASCSFDVQRITIATGQNRTLEVLKTASV